MAGRRAGRTGIGGLAVGGGIGSGRRDVLGLDQALDDLQRPVASHGGDGSANGEILAAEPGAAFDRRLDRVQTGLKGLAFGNQLVSPRVVVEVHQLVVAGLQPLDLGGLLVRGLPRLRMHPPVARRGAPVDFRARLGPLPAGREFVRGGREPLHGQFVQKRGVLEPDAVLVLVGEQVLKHRAAGGLVGVDAHEPGDGGARRDPLLGQQALHLPGRGPVALPRDLLPRGALALAVRRHGESLECFQVDLLVPVGIEEFRGGIAETQPLLDQALGHPEARGDGGHGRAGLGELGERGHLVGGVHGHAHDVFCQGQLPGVAVGGDAAGHRQAGLDGAGLGQRLERRETPPAGHDGEALRVAAVFGADDEVLQQAVGLDGGSELRLGRGVGRGLAHVLGREREVRKRDLADGGIGRGSDGVHAVLHG